MLKLKSLENQSKVNLKFKDWLELKRSNNESIEGRYLVTYIMAPSKYPYATFVFETNKERVRFTVSKDAWTLFKHEYNITGKDIEGKEFYVVIQGNDINIDAVEPNDDFKEAVYTFDRKKLYWKLEYRAKVKFDEDDDAIELP